MPHDHDHAPSADVDRPLSRFETMEIALRELMIEAGVATADEIAEQVDRMDARSPALGAQVVAKAWTDPVFKARLLADGSDACRSVGVEVEAMKLVVLENTPEAHNLVVCTLCSCYPRNLLGLPPAWYKSRAYRTRAVIEPRTVLAEFGVAPPPEQAVRVHDSTADMRYLVLPMRPAGTDDWDAERLATLVTRDSMIGVGLPTPTP